MKSSSEVKTLNLTSNVTWRLRASPGWRSEEDFRKSCLMHNQSMKKKRMMSCWRWLWRSIQDERKRFLPGIWINHALARVNLFHLIIALNFSYFHVKKKWLCEQWFHDFFSISNNGVGGNINVSESAVNPRVGKIGRLGDKLTPWREGWGEGKHQFQSPPFNWQNIVLPPNQTVPL